MSRASGQSPTLGVPRVHYLDQNPPHSSDRPVTLEVGDIQDMNSRYGVSYWEEMHSRKSRRARSWT